jgi:hypothetical protein
MFGVITSLAARSWNQAAGFPRQASGLFQAQSRTFHAFWPSPILVTAEAGTPVAVEPQLELQQGRDAPGIDCEPEKLIQCFTLPFTCPNARIRLDRRAKF